MGKKRFKKNWIMLSKERGGSFLKHAEGSGRRGYDMDMFVGYQTAFDDVLTTKRLAIDVGASYGFVTDFLSQQFDKVISSEVVPLIRDCLKVNVERRELNNVEVLEFGFSDQNTVLDIYFDERFSGHSSAIPNEASGNVATPCEVKTIDSCNYNDVDYIKIDVEGHELYVLKGAIETLKRCRPMVSIEVSLDNPKRLREAVACCTLLEELGYEHHSTATHDFIFIFKEGD